MNIALKFSLAFLLALPCVALSKKVVEHKETVVIHDNHETVGEKASRIAGKVADKTREVATTVKDKTVEAAHVVADKTTQAAHKVQDKTVQAAHAVTN